MGLLRNLFLAVGLLSLATSPDLAAAKPAKVAPAQKHWVTVWASAQMAPDAKNALPSDLMVNTSLRQIVRVSNSGSRIRVRFSNAFGTEPLVIKGATVALAESPDRSALKTTPIDLTFNGQSSVTIPVGADYFSDPIALKLNALDDVAISIWQEKFTEKQTSHPGSRATTYVVTGNHIHDPIFEAAITTPHWYVIAGLELEAPAQAASIVIMGDSITDGYGVKPDTNTRWPDRLMVRLVDAKMPLSVLNQGIGGNRLLDDGLGPNASARFDRDVLSQNGVKYLIILEGVNDLGMATRDAPISPEAHTALVERMIMAYSQIIDKAHARGIKVIGATIMPYGGNSYYHPDGANEADRQAINHWIRTSGRFDAVIDFDALTRDPEHPERLRPEFDSGDHLHPSIDGYKAMGDFVDLTLFRTNRP